jgi:thymidylate synthase
MKQYLDNILFVLNNGLEKGDRTGTGTVSVIGQGTSYDLLGNKVPVVTLKKTNLRSVIHELLWFIKGDTNIQYLLDNNVHIWDEWADDEGNLGPVYGKQWRYWDDIKLTTIGSDRAIDLLGRGYQLEGSMDTRWVFTRKIDQLQNAIDLLRTDPDSRRIIVSSWNPGDLEDMALAPCHCFFQFFSEEVEGKRYLTCLLYQRSADMFLGVPFNIASYAILTHLIASITNHTAAGLIHVTGDTHVYQNHLDVAASLSDLPMYDLPTLRINSRKEIDEFTFEDIEILGYQSGPWIKAPVAV